MMTKCLNCGTTQGPFWNPDGLGKMCVAKKGSTQKQAEERVRECNGRREKLYTG